ADAAVTGASTIASAMPSAQARTITWFLTIGSTSRSSRRGTTHMLVRRREFRRFPTVLPTLDVAHSAYHPCTLHRSEARALWSHRSTVTDHGIAGREGRPHHGRSTGAGQVTRTGVGGRRSRHRGVGLAPVDVIPHLSAGHAGGSRPHGQVGGREGAPLPVSVGRRERLQPGKRRRRANAG